MQSFYSNKQPGLLTIFAFEPKTLRKQKLDLHADCFTYGNHKHF